MRPLLFKSLVLAKKVFELLARYIISSHLITMSSSQDHTSQHLLPHSIHRYRFQVIIVTNLPGIANGAGIPYISVLALNVRTEIAYGMSKDGCLTLFWRNEHFTFLARNWDWQEEQQENLINLNIRQESKPSISIITEEGIIGKIGLNSSSVGVCLNAIRAFGVDFERLPCHLALRCCLESEDVVQAVAALQKTGVASALPLTCR